MSVFVKAKASRSRSLKAILGGAAVLGVSALVLSGCAAPAAPEETTGPREDLTLKIGTILPQSGALAFLGPPEEAGVQLAVNDINDANLGIKVDAVFRDSGDTTTDTATTSVTDLLSQDVSAIIGAASSGVSFTVIDQITGAGVVQISPANTSPDFTDYDDSGLYFRTAPSDLLQGEVLGNLIAEDGAATLGLLVLNDAYGTGLAAALTETYEGAGGEVVAEALFNEGDTSFDAQISTLTAANPDAIAVITFDQAKVVVPALVGAGYPGSQLYFVDGNLADYSADFAPGLVAGSKGTLPGPAIEDDFRERLLEVDPDLADFSYASESYDATILVALAALAANSTDGTKLAEKLQEVSGGGDNPGEKFTTFKDAAAAIIAGDVVDYDGPSGPITFDENGDPTEATIGIFQYKDDNTYERIN